MQIIFDDLYELLKELKKDIPIESIRTTYKTLDHTITFNNEYEEITITHKVKDKLAYAKGVKDCLDNFIKEKSD